MSFNRSGYIGRAPGDSSIVLAKQYFQPTGAGKTFTFTAGYDPGLIDVYRNGVKLINVLDYAATDGSTIVLDTPVGVGSTVQVVAYKGFNLAEVNSSGADFNVGTNLYVQSGFGSFSQGITANQINVTGIGTIGIGSFTDINVSGGATVEGTLVSGSFSGDGSLLTNVSGIVTANIVSVATTTGLLNVTGTTDSTSSSTGSVTIAGGVGIAKNVYIGAGLSVAGTLTYEDVTNVDSVGLITAKSGVNVSGGQVTIGTGITMGIAGIVTSQGLRLADNKQIKFGTGDDSGMYYTGSHLYIDNNTAGDAYLRSTNINLQVNSASSSENAIVATANDAVDIYFNGSKKFETTNDGVVITGICTADGLRLGDNESIKVGNSDDFEIKHDGSDSWIRDSGTGKLMIDSSQIQLRKYGAAEVMANFIEDGAVELYWDNNKKLSTQQYGVDAQDALFIKGAESTSATLHLMADEADDNADSWRIVNDTSDNILYFQNYTTGSYTTTLKLNPNGAVEDSKGDVRQIVYQNKTSGYVLVAADAGKAIHISTGGVTINNSLFSAGDAVTIINNSGSNQTITQGSGVTLYDTGDDGSTGNKTLKGRGMATVWFSSASVGYISGNFD